jgi:hypothetical protein
MDHEQEVDFVQYLADRGLISPALAEDIRHDAHTQTVPLGKILLEDGALGVRDVMKVLACQADAPGERFGEIALRLKMISSTQLEAALQRQSTARRHQLEVVRARGALSPCELESLTLDYLRFLELRITEPQLVVTPAQYGDTPTPDEPDPAGA